MQDKFEKIKFNIGIIILVQVVGMFFGTYLFGFSFMITGGIVFVLNTAFIYTLVKTYEEDNKKKVIDVTRILGSDAKDAFTFGKLGMVTYDDNYNITWMSDLFEDYNMDFIGEKVTMWFPEVNALLQGEEDKVVAEFEEHYFEIVRKSDSQILFVKDISLQHYYQTNYQNEQVVLGMIHLDNYEETTQYAEEQTISFIDSQLRQPVVDWARRNGMFIRRVKQDRFLVVLNEQIFENIVNDRFSILSYIRNESQENEVSITLSMAFARGSNDFSILDEMVNSSLELAQSRGGDQVAIKKYGEDVKYFGGGSEAQEKRSRVRVRVMAQTLRDLIQHASNIIIVGHKDVDFDCMGAALGISQIANSYEIPAYILSKTGGVEAKLMESLRQYQTELNERHNFVTDKEALDLLNKESLVIMVDHHNAIQSNGASIIEQARKIVVIDHHRRGSDFTFNPLMVYIEAAASSVSELVTELFSYQTANVELPEVEATIMFTGMLVDTNRFRNRTGSRTFEAAALLKKFGADPVRADAFLKDSFNDFELKTSILKYCEKRDNGVIIAPYVEGILSRSMMSQVADMILGVNGVEAAFVVSMIDEVQVAVSARSRGKVNVQTIMEQMNGGGHFTAAALQRENETVENIVIELDKTLGQYFEEVNLDESNITK